MSKALSWLGHARLGVETRLRWELAKPRGQAAPGRVAAGLRVEAGELVLSEWLVLTGLALAVLLSRLNYFTPLARFPGFAHMPGALLLAGFALTIVGGLIFRARLAALQSPCPPIHTLWPLMLLAAFILSGSIYQQYVDKGLHTFRIAGSYMLVAYMVARVVMVSANPGRLVMGYFVLLVVAAVPTLAVMGYFFGSGKAKVGPFHELEFLVLPLTVFWIMRKRQVSVFATMSFWVSVACALIFLKNSAYLVALGMVLYAWLFHWRVNITSKTALSSQLALILGTLAVLSAAGTYLYLRTVTVDLVPHGSPEVRVKMYTLAWNRFLDSPVWGAAYMSPAVQLWEDWDTGIAGNLLVTHSDLMDLLASGGLIAATLWVMGHILLFRAVHRHILSRRNEIPPNVIGLTHTLCCMVLLGIATYAFNPLWLNPTRALLIWTNLGLLAGMVAAYSRPAVAAPAKAR